MIDKVTAIPRSQNLMTREEFMRLKAIHDNNPWLAYENVNGFLRYGDYNMISSVIIAVIVNRKVDISYI